MDKRCALVSKGRCRVAPPVSWLKLYVNEPAAGKSFVYDKLQFVV
jgi:hypothetical protein